MPMRSRGVVYIVDADVSVRQGLARLMLEVLATWTRSQSLEWLWLEVRVGNAPAIRVYERHGFRRVGLRKDYYPADHGVRESAIVMSLHLT